MPYPSAPRSLGRNVALLLPIALAACTTAAADGPEGSLETLVLHELATQVTVSTGHGLARLDADSVVEGVGGAIMLNSELVMNGTFKDAGLQSTVDGGRVVGTMHGQCLTVGGALSLTPDGHPGTVAKCEQALNIFDRGQILVSGLIEQQNFESNDPQVLAVLGGSGDFIGATGELRVTQLVFPGVIKKLELQLVRKR